MHKLFTATRLVSLLTLAGTVLILSLFSRVAWAQAHDPFTTAPAPVLTDTLKIGIRVLSPYVFREGDRYRGFDIDLWHEIADRNQWKYEFVLKESASDLLAAVQHKEVDIAFAGLTMTKDREEKVDFAITTLEGGLQIMVGVDHDFSFLDMLSSFWSANIARMGLVMLVIIVMAGHVVWLAERGSNPGMPKGYLRGVWEGIWWAGVNLPVASIGDREPHTVIGRLACLAWVFAALVLATNFTAAATTDLTLNATSGEINGIEDLQGRRTVTVAGSIAEAYLKQQNISYSTVKEIENAYSLLEAGQTDAIVFQSPVLQYYANHDGANRVRVVGSPFDTASIGMAVPLGSPMRKLLNYTMIDMDKDGAWDEIYARWFGS